MRAGGARNTVRPSASTAVRLPAGPCWTFSAFTSIAKLSFLSRGSAAASGVFTTSTCWKLSTVAVTLRSTSGRTFSYTALAPSRCGFGSASGQSS